MKNLISDLEYYAADPRKGLPDELFYFVGRLTPYVNVDLLLRDISGNILYTWRNDEYSGTGWHLPGGIVRLQETFAERVRHVAAEEIGVTLNTVRGPETINEIIDTSARERTHFISLLFQCTLDHANNLILHEKVLNNKNMLLTHEIPINLLPKHRIYVDYMGIKKEK